MAKILSTLESSTGEEIKNVYRSGILWFHDDHTCIKNSAKYLLINLCNIRAFPLIFIQ